MVAALNHLMAFLKRQWFLISLAIVLLIGFTAPDVVLVLTGSPIVRNSIVATVLLLMALPLEASAIRQTLSRPLAPGLAIAINAVLLPLAAWPVCRYLLNENFGVGLVVAIAVPCTMASAAVWTRKARGNFSIALLVTVVTNFFCFLVAPFWIFFSTGKETKVSFEEMVFKLALVVVLPMMIGQLLRLRHSVGTWATNHGTQMSAIAQVGILLMVCSGAAQAALRMSQADSRFELGGFLLMLVAANVLHIGALQFGVTTARLCGLPRADQIAVGISGSQKTLMVGIVLALDLGVSILPMLVYHICQLFVDTVIAQRFAAKTENSNA